MRWNIGKSLAAATRVVTVVALGLLVAACGGKTAGGTSSTSQPGATSASSTSSTSAGASTSTSGAPASGSFCALAASLSKLDIARQLSGARSPKAAFQTLLSQEPTILAAAPSQLQAPLHKLFSFFNRLFSELAKVNYNIAKLSTTERAGIISQTQSAAAASRQVEHYLTGTCKLKSSNGG